jgi:hypothetical protein
MREAKIETNLVVVDFGVLEHCCGKCRVLLIEDAEVGAGFFLARSGLRMTLAWCTDRTTGIG